jgi:hypothetical protein
VWLEQSGFFHWPEQTGYYFKRINLAKEKTIQKTLQVPHAKTKELNENSL